jgi:hypothetical protein
MLRVDLRNFMMLAVVRGMSMERIPFSLVGRHRRFGGTSFLLTKDKKKDVLKMGEGGSFVTFVHAKYVMLPVR